MSTATHNSTKLKLPMTNRCTQVQLYFCAKRVIHIVCFYLLDGSCHWASDVVKSIFNTISTTHRASSSSPVKTTIELWIHIRSAPTTSPPSLACRFAFCNVKKILTCLSEYATQHCHFSSWLKITYKQACIREYWTLSYIKQDIWEIKVHLSNHESLYISTRCQSTENKNSQCRKQTWWLWQ